MQIPSALKVGICRWKQSLARRILLALIRAETSVGKNHRLAPALRVLLRALAPLELPRALAPPALFEPHGSGRDAGLPLTRIPKSCLARRDQIRDEHTVKALAQCLDDAAGQPVTLLEGPDIAAGGYGRVLSGSRCEDSQSVPRGE